MLRIRHAAPAQLYAQRQLSCPTQHTTTAFHAARLTTHMKAIHHPFSTVCVPVQLSTSIDLYNACQWLEMVIHLQCIAPHAARPGSAWLHACLALAHLTFTAACMRRPAC